MISYQNAIEEGKKEAHKRYGYFPNNPLRKKYLNKLKLKVEKECELKLLEELVHMETMEEVEAECANVPLLKEWHKAFDSKIILQECDIKDETKNVAEEAYLKSPTSSSFVRRKLRTSVVAVKNDKINTPSQVLMVGDKEIKLAQVYQKYMAAAEEERRGSKRGVSRTFSKKTAETTRSGTRKSTGKTSFGRSNTVKTGTGRSNTVKTGTGKSSSSKIYSRETDSEEKDPDEQLKSYMDKYVKEYCNWLVEFSEGVVDPKVSPEYVKYIFQDAMECGFYPALEQDVVDYTGLYAEALNIMDRKREMKRVAKQVFVEHPRKFPPKVAQKPPHVLYGNWYEPVSTWNRTFKTKMGLSPPPTRQQLSAMIEQQSETDMLAKMHVTHSLFKFLLKRRNHMPKFIASAVELYWKNLDYYQEFYP